MRRVASRGELLKKLGRERLLRYVDGVGGARYAAENGIVVKYWDGRIRSYIPGRTPLAPILFDNDDYRPDGRHQPK